MTLIRDTDLQQFAGDDLTMFDFKLADTAPVLVGIMLGAGWYAGVTSLLSFPAAPLIAATGGGGAGRDRGRRGGREADCPAARSVAFADAAQVASA